MEEIKTHPVEFYKTTTWYLKKEWRWRIKAQNGNIIASSSEGYRNKKDCDYNAKSTAFSILEYFDY